MSVVAVDLAAKYSAVLHVDGNGRVEDEWDSIHGEDHFIASIVSGYRYSFADQLVVEDLPHGVEYRGLVKRVCQIQGRLVERMHSIDKLNELMFVAPETWRRHYPPLRKRGTGMEAVVPIAGELGYTAPDLSHLHGPRGGKALADKVATDYCAAYLIARWALDQFERRGHWQDWPGTNRYGQPTIRKNEDHAKV